MAKKAAAKPKASGGGTKFIAKAPIRRLMKGQGASLVAEEALLALIGQLETYGADVTKAAIGIAQKDKRKRVTADDIAAAAKGL
ncbi:MAG: histone [Candidatus Hodarchaeota archaeon]